MTQAAFSTVVDPLRHLALPPAAPPEILLTREWIVGNGLGGYASGTVGGMPSRRYHGALIAALPNPAGRVMMLHELAEQIKLRDGSRIDIGWVSPSLASTKALALVDFQLVAGLPIWRYSGYGITLERRITLAYGLNTSCLSYRLLEGEPVRVEVRPALQFRGHDEHVSVAVPAAYPLHAVGNRIELTAPAPLPALKLACTGKGSTFVIEPMTVPDHSYTVEEARGYDSVGALYSPGRFRAELAQDSPVMLVASADTWETVQAIEHDQLLDAELERRRRLLLAAPPAARQGPAAELVLAADAFVIRPAGRVEDHIRARITGDEAWTVIAGYHWFTDWGRDTMISLEGLTLATGRVAEAGSILRMFAHHVQDGLVPNMFPEGESHGLYHTADATLWFFHAIDRYVRVSGDLRTLDQFLPILVDIFEHHMAGTRFGIGVDPADGLLREGAPGYQLTWMDAKAGDWVVTPRRGKPVEINALFYNALRLLQGWLEASGDAPTAARVQAAADRVYDSFGKRFWNEATGYCFDVVDDEKGGNDPAMRPNQLFAISLAHPVLPEARWASVVAAVERELLTPVGLRSLSPNDPDYKRLYRGDLLTRDAAYHQGTVWSWLIGPYVDARLRVYPDDVAGARRALDGLVQHLGENCIGFVGEVFDGEMPFLPGGCVAQAWGVAELLRCLLKTAPPAEKSS